MRLVSFTALDQGGDPRIHTAQLAAGQDRDHRAAQAVFQPAKHERATRSLRRGRDCAGVERRRKKCWMEAHGPGSSAGPAGRRRRRDYDADSLPDRPEVAGADSRAARRRGIADGPRARWRSSIAAATSSRRGGCGRRRGATLQTLADRYGVSAERIRQIESKAIKTMRGQMDALH